MNGVTRYVLVPGMVRSPSDGDWHLIDANTLAGLFGVRRKDCVDASQLG